MSVSDTAATEYHNLPLTVLTKPVPNPRRIFDDDALSN
jgi:hypothetical protein